MKDKTADTNIQSSCMHEDNRGISLSDEIEWVLEEEEGNSECEVIRVEKIKEAIKKLKEEFSKRNWETKVKFEIIDAIFGRRLIE